MSKKHHKTRNREGFDYGYGQPWPNEGFGPAQAPWGAYPPGYGQAHSAYGPQPGYAPDMGMPPEAHGHGYNHHDDAAAYGPGYGSTYGYGGGFRHSGNGYGSDNYAPGGFNRDFLRETSSLFSSQHTDQFLLGLLLGAGAAWVLSDEEIRGKLIKSVMKAYAGVAGGFEELKEQMADIRAEVAAERHGDE
ncbi:hypothetical protein [Methylomicrobium album]|uniref:Uncharacterized protein n=1 Tax=Methylomicrobium album BG8 TaxID=686340 RepID=H8GGV2_METAL|nr:hypothetical protein [Methylomicrobium album]EIC30065.1 hypothetical protein Metal_2329 [Methylomicrobium album BG8]